MSKKNKGGKSSSRKPGKREIKLGLALFLPLILVLSVIPLIVRLHLVTLPAEVSVFWKTDYVGDFFSYYKSRALFVTVLYMALVFLYYKAQGLKERLPIDRPIAVYLVTNAVFLLVSILATLFSDYQYFAVWGAPERCEGLLTLLLYPCILFFALWAYRQKPDFRYVLLPLCVLVGATTFLGIFQFFGHDIFFTEAGQKLVIPSAYRGEGEMLSQFPEGKIYGTMYHYNYMGSFGAMMLPLFLVLALFLKDRRGQILCAVFAAFSLFLLLGSTSRAGIVGMALAAVCFLIFFARKLLQHYKATLGCIAVMVLLVLVVNIVTGGLALARIPSLLSDVKALVTPSDVDYHDLIPLREIDLTDDAATFVFQEDSVTVEKNADGQPVFTLSDGQVATAPADNASVMAGTHPMELQYLDLPEGRTAFLGIYVGDRIQMILGLFDDGFSFVDSRIHKLTYEEAPSIGFAGKEKLGSSRGYIWSRSLPLLLDHMFIGSGPDTFLAEFPQGDFLAKLYAYDDAQMLVDKAHNLYLQIGINEGGIALLAFLVMMGVYLVDSFRLYALRREYNSQQAIGAALALAIIGYLGAGFFNDSVVSIAPIFWALFGVGAAVNQLNRVQKGASPEKKK